MGRKTRGNTPINSNTEKVSNLDDELSKQGETLNDMLMSTKTGLIKATFKDPRRNIIAFCLLFWVNASGKLVFTAQLRKIEKL